MATITACAVGNRLEAIAQNAVEPASNAPAAAQGVRHFHILAGPLNTALEAYRQQSGSAVKITLGPGQVAGFQTAGLQGLYKPKAALRELLKGTGLSCMFAGADQATVGLQRSETVDVSAQLPAAVSMARFTEDLLHTPQTVAVVPDFVLHDEQNRILTDAVRNVPGISIAAGESGAGRQPHHPRIHRA